MDIFGAVSSVPPLASLGKRAPIDLDVDVVFFIFILVLVIVAAATATAVALRTAVLMCSIGAEDLHGERLISVILECQVLPAGEVTGTRERFPSPAQEHGVVDGVLNFYPGGAVGAAVHLQPVTGGPVVVRVHRRRKGVRQMEPAAHPPIQIYDELEWREAGVGRTPRGWV